MGFGKHPAVVVIDFSYGFTDPNEPFGGNYDNEVSACLRVLEAAREKNVSIVYTTVAYYHSEEAGVWLRKNAMLRHLMLGTRQVEIDKRLKPRENETVIVKKYTSGFAGTHLESTENFV